MTDLVDGAAVFEAREAEMRSLAEASRPQAPAPNSRVSVGPNVYSYVNTPAPAPAGPAIDSHLDRDNPSILATGRSEAGFQRAPAELRLDDVVTIHGDPTSVRVALRLGYLEGTPGNFKETGLAAREATGEVPDTTPKSDVRPDYTGDETPLTDHIAEKLLGEIVGASPAGHQISAMNDVINTGEVSTNTLTAMASIAGVSPQRLQADLSRVQDAFADQAFTALRDMGVTDPAAFDAWAEANHGSEYKDAMSRHVLDRNPKAYEKLAMRYRRDTADDFSEEDLLEATSGSGVQVRKTPEGQLVVNLPGIGETSLASARRNGWINIRQG